MRDIYFQGGQSLAAYEIPLFFQPPLPKTFYFLYQLTVDKGLDKTIGYIIISVMAERYITICSYCINSRM